MSINLSAKVHMPYHLPSLLPWDYYFSGFPHTQNKNVQMCKLHHFFLRGVREKGKIVI